MLLRYFLAGAVLTIGIALRPSPPDDEPAARKTYATLCAGCHGPSVETFVDRKWKYGSTHADFVKNISKGFPNLGMPAWEESLKPQQIEELASLIEKSIERGKTFEPAREPKSAYFKAKGVALQLDTVAAGLGSPWGMAFLPGGEMLVTDRGGKIYRIGSDGQKTEISGGPQVVAEGQGGLLDLTLHPKFEQNQLVYFSFSKAHDTDPKLATTAVMRAKLNGNTLADSRVVFEAKPYQTTRHHYGSRLVFGRDGMLYVSVGDRGQHVAKLPQQLDNDMGKIHRMKDDGSIPADNPFAKSPNPTIWSYGHRNPQGLTLGPDGTLWENEHGPRGGDEINRIVKGKNYGWPVISYGIDYSGKPLAEAAERPGIEPPFWQWTPSIGPSGMAVVTGDKYPGWKGDLLSGSLRFMYLAHSGHTAAKVTQQEKLYPNIGRVRDVKMGPDGYVYLSVEQPGYVFRLLPKK